MKRKTVNDEENSSDYERQPERRVVGKGSFHWNEGSFCHVLHALRLLIDVYTKTSGSRNLIDTFYVGAVNILTYVQKYYFELFTGRVSLLSATNDVTHKYFVGVFSAVEQFQYSTLCE